METKNWIALGLGIVFILILVYLMMRRRRGQGGISRPEEGREEAPAKPAAASPLRKEKEEREDREEKPAPAAPPRREERKGSLPGESTLPVYDAPIPETADIERESFKEFAGRRLLVVDDNHLNLKLILKLMEGSGLEIETATDGNDALAKLRAPDARYDLVLMDVNMPGMDGLECTRQIRRDPQLSNLPVLALTASTQKEEVERILQSGMNSYLDKPLVLGKLYSAFKLFLPRESQLKAERVMIAGEGENKGLVTNARVLDIRSALAHTNNNESLYRSLLEEFLKEYSDCDRRFKELVEAKEYEELHRLLVDLDGLTGMLGAMELYGLVDRLKQIVEKGTYTLLEDYVSECHEAYQRFRREARRYLVH